MDLEADLIGRLRERALDPTRRRDASQSEFGAMVTSLDLASLVAQISSLGEELTKVRADPAAAQDADLRARLDGWARDMSTPASTDLPAPATEAELAAAESALGVTLPALLRRVLAEVANGGFGPGEGLLGVGDGWSHHGHDLGATYDMLVDGPYDEWHWPRGLLPLCHLGDGAYALVDATDPAAPVVEWDEEIWDEDEDDDVPTSPTLTAVQPSLAQWFEVWVTSPSPPIIGVDVHAVGSIEFPMPD